MTEPAWNLLVYAVADDPAQHAAVTGAIAQMHDALTTDDCNIVVQVHAKAKTTRHWIAHKKRVRVESLPGRPDASDPDVLTAFMNAAHRAQPAKSTALVLFAHRQGLDDVHGATARATAPAVRTAGRAPAAQASGTAMADVFDRVPANHNLAAVGQHEVAPSAPAARKRWTPRWGPDPHNQQYLHNVDMRRAISRSLQKRVQVLGLNACWMASLEIEYEFRGIADIQIASQGYVTPWPYGAIVAALREVPAPGPAELARAIVAAVRDDIAANERQETISAFSSGPSIEALAAAFDPLARRALAMVDAKWEAIAKVVAESERVDDPYQVDLYSLASALARQDGKAKAAAAPVIAQLAAMLVARAASDGHRHAHGLSIFCPRTSDVDLADAYRGIEFRTRPWAAFLRAYHAKLKSHTGDE